MKLAPEPKYKTLYSAIKKENEALKVENELLKDKIYNLSKMVLPGEFGEVVIQDGMLLITVPKYVAEWMIEYSMPWQVFKCDAHGLWINELDSSFPYHMEQCTCCKC